MYILLVLLLLGFFCLYFIYIRNANSEDKTRSWKIKSEELSKKKYSNLHISSSQSVYVAKSHILGAGRGVFAEKMIKKGEIIETCPVIKFSPEESSLLNNTKLKDYFFRWDNENLSAAISLGFGSLYNHSATPNAGAIQIKDKELLQLIALKDIQNGEEITFNYGWNPLEHI